MVDHPAPAARRRILIVDDDRLILATLKKGLEQAGYAVVQATSGEEGWLLARSAAPDLALLDVRMPGMSGLELAQRLRSETEVPFIFFTAYGDLEIARQAADYGAVGYLVKPIDTPQIIPAIEAGLARAAEIRSLRNSEANLTAALTAGRETNIATGVVMERYRVSRQRAYDILRDIARTRRRKINEVATSLIEAEETLNGLQLELQADTGK